MRAQPMLRRRHADVALVADDVLLVVNPTDGQCELTRRERLARVIAASGWTVDMEIGTLVMLARSEDPEVSVRAISVLRSIINGAVETIISPTSGGLHERALGRDNPDPEHEVGTDGL